MNSDPYNLTSIRANPDFILPIEQFPELPDLSEEVARLMHIKEHYFQQRCEAKEIFEELAREVNRPILNGLDKFVSKSLGDPLFPNNVKRISAATLFLDMQTSDHDPTFDMIEKHLSSFKGLCIQRVKSNLRRKRNLLTLLDSSVEFPYLFMIIEQAETIDTCLADLIIGNLHRRLHDSASPTERIMVLFCMSTKLQDLPFDSMGCFGRITTIKRDAEVDKKIVKERLLRSPRITMKLGHQVLDFIYECFMNDDASIANVRHMFDFTMHEYCRKLSWLDDFKEIASDQSKFAKDVKENHDFLCDQLHCYYELIRAEESWPADVTELYDELLTHDDFASSPNVYEAIKYSLKLSRDVLLSRFQRTIKSASQFKNNSRSVIKIIRKYVEIIENNDNCEQMITKFVNELFEHAKSLQNPLRMQYKEAYYCEVDNIILGTLDTLRTSSNFETKHLRFTPHYKIICDAVFRCPAQVAVNDLWRDVQNPLEDLIREDREKVTKNKGLKPTKSTPRKKPRLTTQVKKKDDPKEDQRVTGIAKSLFLDLITTLEHQHIIRLDRKGSKGLILRRSVWLR